MTTPYTSVDPVLWPVQPTSQGPCWGAGSGTVTVVNLDPGNYIYVGFNPNILPGVGANTAPLGPGASMTFPGTRSMYVVAPANTKPCLLMPGSIQYSPPVPGVTPLVQIGSLSGAGSENIAASTTLQVLNLVDVSQFASYDVSMYVYGSGATAGASTTTQVIMQWFDDLSSGIPVYQEDWFPMTGTQIVTPVAGASGQPTNPLSGSGPNHGRYLSVYLGNQGTITQTVQWFNLFGSNRPLINPSWRQNPGIPGPAINGAIRINNNGSDIFANHAADLQGFSPSGTGVFWMPIGMCPGPVWFSFQVVTTAMTHDAVIVDLSFITGGSLVGGDANEGIVVDLGNTLNTFVQEEVLFPRAACALVIQAPTTSVISFKCIPQIGSST